MAKPSPKERNNELYEAILSLKDLDECISFFDDICAMNELRSIEQRFEVAKMLKEEKVYTEIMQKTKASSATISRVNRMLNYGTGCLGNVLARMKAEESNNE